MWTWSWSKNCEHILKDVAHVTKHLKGMAMMKSTITKNGLGTTSVMEKLLYYWYVFGSCVCDIRYDEQWWSGPNPTYVKIDLWKSCKNGLLTQVGSRLYLFSLKSCSIWLLSSLFWARQIQFIIMHPTYSTFILMSYSHLWLGLQSDLLLAGLLSKFCMYFYT